MPPKFQPPRDDLVRACYPGAELRGLTGFSLDDEGHVRAANGDAPVMHGHFSVFNTWSEINSLFEGDFMEQFAPGSFKRTINNNRDGMRAIFQHGRDPQVADKPLGSIDVLKEDGTGPYFEVGLLDAAYVRDLVLPGLRAGLYGVSFRFRVIRENINEEPAVSDHNPKGLPERVVQEVEVREFGPVTYPAYPEADIAVRSMTDELMLGQPGELMRCLSERVSERLADELRTMQDKHEKSVVDSTEHGHDGARPEGHRPGVEKRPARDYLDPKEHEPSWKL